MSLSLNVTNAAPAKAIPKIEIPVFKPLIEAEEMEAARKALELGWLGMGSFVGEFERKLQDYVSPDSGYVVALSTGHAALHLGLLLMGVGPGDEVITPSFNNTADFQAILATGASLVFCDVEDQTLCIDLEKAEQLVSPRTKAIIVMDYDCILCDHDKVAEFARRHKIRVLHDAAHAFGSKYKGKKVGSFSDMTMFSFDPVKTITCIDGGALIVRTEEERARLHSMRLVGMGQAANVMYTNNRAWTYDVATIGFRYHMANLHAAIGLAQLAKINRIAEARRSLSRRYNSMLFAIPEVRTPKTDFHDIVPFLYYIRVPAAARDGLRKHLFECGIDTGIHWQPGHHFSLFKDCRKGDLSVTEKLSGEILSLPLHSDMTSALVQRVVDGIATYFQSVR
jgi:dTDP-4-amino-4,6-dideoxygalactose transaminase